MDQGSIDPFSGPGPWTWSIVLPIEKVSQTFIKANLRPKNFCLGLIKNFCLGLIRPKVSSYKCLGYFLYWYNNGQGPWTRSREGVSKILIQLNRATLIIRVEIKCMYVCMYLFMGSNWTPGPCFVLTLLCNSHIRPNSDPNLKRSFPTNFALLVSFVHVIVKKKIETTQVTTQPCQKVTESNKNNVPWLQCVSFIFGVHKRLLIKHERNVRGEQGNFWRNLYFL